MHRQTGMPDAKPSRPLAQGKTARAGLLRQNSGFKIFPASAASKTNGADVRGKNSGADGGALALSRTDSQRLGALTGRSRAIARAALNAVGDPDSAFKLLMSDLALTVVDALPCEIEPLSAGSTAWLEGTGEVLSVGAFEGCSILRIHEGRKEVLQLFALEPVDVCLLTKGTEQLEGWVELEYTELPEVVGVEAGLTMQTRKFDPGAVDVPLAAALLPPIVRVVGKRAVAPPRNSLLPRSLAAPQSAPVTGRRRAPLPVLPEADSEARGAEEVGSTGRPPGQPLDLGANADVAAGGDDTEPASGSKRYNTLKSVGRGSFGTVYLAEDSRDGQRVAIKCICQSSGHRVAMREVQLLSEIQHPCVIALLDSFDEAGEDGKEAMHIVMEFLPQNLHQRIAGKPLKLGHVRCFSFQLLRALAHLDGMKVCHRDLKPENVLLKDRALKLADFGSAKVLGSGPSTNYICSRWWRAPELVLGTSEYSTSVDWWSCGCVVAEMMLGRPLFMGQSSLGQMYEIMKALGTPSPDDIQAMHPRRGLGRIAEQLMKLSKLQRAARPWPKLLPAFAGAPGALNLAERLLMYSPSARLHPAEALSGLFFAPLPLDKEELGPLPVSLFEFTEVEMSSLPATSREVLASLAVRRAEWMARKEESRDVSAGSANLEVSSLGADEDSVIEAHCEEAPAAGDAPVVAPGRRNAEAAEGRQLKRRRLAKKKTVTPICIRLDSEDLNDDI